MAEVRFHVHDDFRNSIAIKVGNNKILHFDAIFRLRKHFWIVAVEQIFFHRLCLRREALRTREHRESKANRRKAR
ncbi:hypothetical protein D0T23_06185 [Duganella sp. BJB475]|nr:hypothetical protein D0T23_06185 [Duganella sp. BJB475]RFP35939.1 hypothetical protein D0T21_05730 [Duganella sp. BJB476]